MSGTDYSYDDKGQFFPFFILTISGLVTLPLTYTLLKPSSEPVATAPRIQSDFVPEHADIIQAERKKQRRRERRLKRIVTVVIGWAIIGLMAYLIHSTARTIPKIWNPYDILGISDSSSEKQIKSHYKKLSLKFHPDKIKPDPAKNETIESLNDYFVELTKAYKALTDEEVRNNYIQYGHPDGKQSFSIGIALPQFIIEEGNGKYVLIVYALLLGVLLPYLVGSWWYGTQRMSKERILIESANNLFREYTDNMTEGDVITALSSGAEFQSIMKGDKTDSGLAKLESRILAEGEATPLTGGLTLKDKTKLEDLDSGIRRKALALLWAYLGRVELDDASLNEKRFEVAPVAQALNQAFLAITLAFGSTGPILASFTVAQSLVQAIPPKASPLLQLPHFTPKIAQAIKGDSKIHMTVQQFMEIPSSKRRQLALYSGLTESQYTAAVKVAQQIPYLRVSKAFFKVTGEKYITQGSLVSLIVKGRFIPPGTSNIPEVNELDLEDVDPDEDDLDAILGRKKKSVKGESVPVDDKPIQPPLTYAPYFARDHSPRWHFFLSDSKQGKMAVPPFTFSTFDKPIFTEDGKPTFNMQTLKAQFQAPPQAGRYTFVMHLVCDSYVGMDTKMEVTLVVEDASKAQEIQAEDDISDPEEDSIAGQMHNLKTGGKGQFKKKPAIEEDSDESGTDEEDDDTSETNTDTDTDGE